jgi:hypothetical protein
MVYGEAGANEPQRLQPEVIRDLGRTICFGSLIPWLLSGIMPSQVWFFFGCLVAFVMPRFTFRKRKAPVVYRWSQRDWAWTGLAIFIAIAYFSDLTPARFARLIGS